MINKKSISLIAFLAVFSQLALPTIASPTPKEALKSLKKGNKRYLDGISKHPRVDPLRRLKTAKQGQTPIASILSCSDARVPVELIFDQGFGDLFIIRVAGNICAKAELASLEFGTLYLNTPLIVVLGHSKCGAVQAALSDAELKGKLPLLIDEIRPAVKKTRKKHPKLKDDALEMKAIKENVRLSIRKILKSPGIKNAVDDKKVKIVGAVRDLKSGKIIWLK